MEFAQIPPGKIPTTWRIMVRDWARLGDWVRQCESRGLKKSSVG